MGKRARVLDSEDRRHGREQPKLSIPAMLTIFTLTIYTDCSGIDAPARALANLGLPLRHLGVSDINPASRAFLIEQFAPEVMFSDMTQRRIFPARGTVHFYFCGFPCQSFSSAGLNKGLTHEMAGIIAALLVSIMMAQPWVVVIENVPNIIQRHADVLQLLLTKLRAIGK